MTKTAIEFIRRKVGDHVTTKDADGIYLFANAGGEAQVILVGAAAMSWDHGQIRQAVGDLLGGAWDLKMTEPMALGSPKEPDPEDSPLKARQRYERGFWSVILQSRE